MDDAKRPAPETVNFSSCRVVSVRAVPAASPNFAPVYCLMTSEVDGFPIQQAIPLIPLGEAVQGAQTAQAVQPAQPMPSVSSSTASARPKPPQLPPAEIANPDAVGNFQSAVVSRRACASVRLLLSGGCDSVSSASAH